MVQARQVFNRPMLWMLLGCLLLFGGIFAFKMFGKYMMNKALDNMAQPPATVTSSQVEQQAWQQILVAVGSMSAVNGVDVTSQAQGVVSAIHFKSGQRANGGELLVELAAEPEKAQLEVLEAELMLARRDHERIERLHKKGVTTDAELDDVLSRLDQVLARLEVQHATVAQRRITAPFTGQLGIRQVDLGENVSPGDAVVSLQQLEPIFVDFSLPERHFSQVREGQPVEVSTGAFPKEVFPGRITAIDPRVDSASRNFLVQATMKNPDRKLRPGMYADVTVELATERRVLVVPRTAILFAPYGDSVFVLEKSGGAGSSNDSGLVARKRLVKTGEERGDLVEIVEGVEAGEVVATTGLLKLRNDGPVVINNENPPPVQKNPEPENS